MSAPERIADYLPHIVEAIDRIERYAAGMDFDAFAANDMARDAVLRHLANVGKACRHA